MAASYDLESETYVPLPKGEVHKHSGRFYVGGSGRGECEAARCKKDIMSVIGSLVKSGRAEVANKLRREVNKVVKRNVDQGVAEVFLGLVFIDEVGHFIISLYGSNNLTICQGSHARYRMLHVSQCLT